ncbi:juvenile hormone acid O-methyltransferase-like [Branchiostoma lanceolatum]|uniref:juvenile hormone acid O-methyltransferase-like n=1 Tax=Branchiostoma lanceolatum TaxID=7740 RepID=UPI0034553B51
MNATKAEHYSQNRCYQQSFAVEVLQQYMKWEEGDTVLDAGCGTGEICKYISQQPGVASVVGFDVSSEFVSYSSQYNSSTNVLYHVADVSDVTTFKPEWQGAFSKIVSIFVLQWVHGKAEALKAMHSCLKPRGEILLACVSDKSRFCRTWMNMASHPKWKIYLKDFVPNLFPWPSGDLANGHDNSCLLEECGFEVLSCHVKEHGQSFNSKEQWRETFRAVFPHLRYIPKDKHEEFFDDLFETAKSIRFVSADYKTTGDVLVFHARKL